MPPVLNDRYLNLLIVIACNVILAMSIRLIFLAGELNVGHVAFMGIGAYTSALLATRLGLSFWLCLPMAAIMAALVATAIGFLALKAKIKGWYFAILTLAFAQAFTLIVTLWRRLTGGATGILNIPAPYIHIPGLPVVDFGSRLNYYYLALALVFITWVVMSRLEHSRFGLTLIAVRKSEVLSESVGIDTIKYKVIAFAIGCAFAGAVGSFLAHYYYFVSPDQYTLEQTLYIFLYALFGGIGSLAGPVFGATILTLLPEFLRIAQEYEPAIFGFILVITICLLPEGIVGLRKYIASFLNRVPVRV
jgi:branched-chain amino acid transport system permease protein